MKEEGFPASSAEALAGYLGIPRSDMLMIKNHTQDVEGLLGSVIDEWTSREEPSYTKLSEAVKECGYPEIAKKIKGQCRSHFSCPRAPHLITTPVH